MHVKRSPSTELNTVAPPGFRQVGWGPRTAVKMDDVPRSEWGTVEEGTSLKNWMMILLQLNNLTTVVTFLHLSATKHSLPPNKL